MQQCDGRPRTIEQQVVLHVHCARVQPKGANVVQRMAELTLGTEPTWARAGPNVGFSIRFAGGGGAALHPVILGKVAAASVWETADSLRGAAVAFLGAGGGAGRAGGGAERAGGGAGRAEGGAGKAGADESCNPLGGRGVFLEALGSEGSDADSEACMRQAPARQA